jgi:hypothetical protein
MGLRFGSPSEAAGTMQSPSIGDPVLITPLEAAHAAYVLFCEQRSIRPANFETWVKAQSTGWKTAREKLGRDAPSAFVRRQADDTATIRAVLMP